MICLRLIFKAKIICSSVIEKSRFDEHLSRKFFHMASGTVIAYVFATLLTRFQAVVLVTVATAILLPLDLLRLR